MRHTSPFKALSRLGGGTLTVGYDTMGSDVGRYAFRTPVAPSSILGLKFWLTTKTQNFEQSKTTFLPRQATAGSNRPPVYSTRAPGNYRQALEIGGAVAIIDQTNSCSQYGFRYQIARP